MFVGSYEQSPDAQGERPVIMVWPAADASRASAFATSFDDGEYVIARLPKLSDVVEPLERDGRTVVIEGAAAQGTPSAVVIGGTVGIEVDLESNTTTLFLSNSVAINSWLAVVTPTEDRPEVVLVPPGAVTPNG